MSALNLNGKKGNAGNTREQAAAETAAQTGATYGYAQPQVQQPSGLTINGLGRRLAGRQSEAGAVELFCEKLQQLADEPTNKEACSVAVSLLNNERMMAPIVLLSAAQEDEKGLHISYIPVVLPVALKQPLKPVEDTIDRLSGRFVITDRPEAQIMSPNAARWATELLEARYAESGRPANVVEQAPTLVYPKTTSLEDEDAIANLVVSSVNWLADRSNGADDVVRISGSLLSTPNYELRQKPLEVVYEATHDPLGRPVAADFISRMTLASVNRQQQQRQDIMELNSEEEIQSLPVVEATAIVDFLPHRNQGINEQQLRNSNPNAQSFPGFIPTIVMTSAHNSTAGAQTVEDMRTQLLGIVALWPIAADYGWVRKFESRPKNAVKEDLGVLSMAWDPMLQGAKGMPAKLTASSTIEAKGADKPIDYARDMCSESPVIAIDFVKGSYSASYQREFVMAAMSTDAQVKSEAVAEIYAQADALTNNKFTETVRHMLGLMPGSALPNPMREQTVTLHGGDYTAGGTRRSLGELGLLASYEFAGNDIAARDDAIRALVDLGNNDLLVQTNRRKVLSAICGSSMDINTLSNRLFLQSWFAPALFTALRAGNINVSSEDVNPYPAPATFAHGIDPNEYAANLNGAGFYRTGDVHQGGANLFAQAGFGYTYF